MHIYLYESLMYGRVLKEEYKKLQYNKLKMHNFPIRINEVILSNLISL